MSHTEAIAHPDNPEGPRLFCEDGSTHTEALIALLRDEHPDLVITRRADLVTVLEASLLPSQCDDDDWDNPVEAAEAREAEARLIGASELRPGQWSHRTT